MSDELPTEETKTEETIDGVQVIRFNNFEWPMSDGSKRRFNITFVPCPQLDDPKKPDQQKDEQAP